MCVHVRMCVCVCVCARHAQSSPATVDKALAVFNDIIRRAPTFPEVCVCVCVCARIVAVPTAPTALCLFAQAVGPACAACMCVCVFTGLQQARHSALSDEEV